MLEVGSLVITVVGVTISLLIGAFVLVRNRRMLLNILFAFFAICVSILTIANYFSLFGTELLMREWGVRTVMLMASVLVALVYAIFGRMDDRTRHISRSDWLVIAVTLVVSALHFTSFFLIGMRDSSHYPSPIVGSGIVIFFAHFVALLTLSVARLFRRFVRSQGSARSRSRVLIIGTIPTLLLAPVTSIVLPMVFDQSTLIPISPLYVTFFLCCVAYAIVRHGLFDIRLAAVRTVGYSLTIAAMAGIYVLLAYSASIIFFGGAVTDGVGLSPANVAIALVLAFMFQPIRYFFDQLTNRIFYRGSYDRDEFLHEFGKTISRDTDLSLLLRQSSAHVGKTMSAEAAFFYVNNKGVAGRYNAKKAHMLNGDIAVIEAWFDEADITENAILLRDNVDEDMRQILGNHQVRIAMRLAVGRQTLGYLFLGEHKGRGYSPRDIRTLGMINNELAIAIQNALSVEEVRDLNRTLEQRIARATKELRESNRQLKRLDEAKTEFVSMASHQLRTPLTSIKGYLDMLLQGDFGKVNGTQRTVLSEAFLSSERMVALINDFLNVSRLQTGRFVIDRSTGDLKEVVRDQVAMLQVIAKQYGLTIEAEIDDEVPVMSVDIDKLRQVVLNFIDNAIYYSKPNTKILVSLTKERRQVVLTVKDTGIGVPESEKSQLFGRFFRAENARLRRPDGTGVGLFLAKKIVLLHGGQIIFESEEGKGSTFGFRLPIASQKQSAKQEA